MLLSQIGGFAVYTLFIAQNLQTVLASKSYGIDWDYRVFLAITLVPILILCSIRNLANLSWVMVVANLFEFYIIAVVFYYLFREPLPSFEGKDLVAPLYRLPISFGSGKKAELGFLKLNTDIKFFHFIALYTSTVMFCFSGVGIILPLENKMKNPKSLGGVGGVLFNGMSFITCLYITIGFFGYLVYGNQMRSSGSITLNLPQDEA